MTNFLFVNLDEPFFYISRYLSLLCILLLGSHETNNLDFDNETGKERVIIHLACLKNTKMNSCLDWNREGRRRRQKSMWSNKRCSPVMAEMSRSLQHRLVSMAGVWVGGQWGIMTHPCSVINPSHQSLRPVTAQGPAFSVATAHSHLKMCKHHLLCLN